MKIIGVFKTHFDYGYTDSQKNILKLYRTEIIDKVLKVIEETQSFGYDLIYKWTLPSWLLMYIYDNATSDRKNKLKEFIEKDYITCHALPFTIHTELLTERQFDDLFIPARRYSETFKKPMPIAAKMTDVPGHTMALIEPLIKNGVKFLHLGKNPYCTAPKVPLLFFWEDTKGNRILTMYNQFYGSKTLPPKRWNYPVWLALNQTGDNAGGHSAKVISDMKDEIGNKGELVIGSLDDFAKEILKCDLSNIPVIRGELGDTWIHGASTYPKELGIYRRIRSEFCRIADEYDLSKFKDLEMEFRDEMIQYVEHTFGINICRYLGYDREYYKELFNKERREREEYKILEASWQEQKDRVYKLERILNEIKKKIDYKEPIKEETASNSKFRIAIERGVPVIYTPKGERIRLEYSYIIESADKLHMFMKKYMVRFSDWSTVDLGKERYPEIDKYVYKGKLVDSYVSDDFIKCKYESNIESYKDFGNCETFEITLKKCNDSVNIHLTLFNKHATPFVENGGMLFKLDNAKGSYIVSKCGLEIDTDKDIVKGANQYMFSMDKYARIGNVVLESIDAPLVSFNKDPILEYSVNRVKKQPLFNINLFNTQWGTNFPQWIEDKELDFEFIIKEKDFSNDGRH